MLAERLPKNTRSPIALDPDSFSVSTWPSRTRITGQSAGAGSVASGIILYYVLMHYPAFGIANRHAIGVPVGRALAGHAKKQRRGLRAGKLVPSAGWDLGYERNLER